MAEMRLVRGCCCLLSANSTSGGERGGGGAVHFWLVQPVAALGGGHCPLSADSTSGVGVLSVCFRLIQPATKGGGGGGGAVCLLSADLTSGGGGVAVRFRLIQPAGWGCCLSAFG